MKKPCVIVDVENTLIDISHRKYDILRRHFAFEGTIEDVQKDSSLSSILGDGKSSTKSNFYKKFNDPNSIASHPAPLFENAKQIIDGLIGAGIEVVLISGRPANFREAMIAELKENGIRLDKISLFINTHSNPKLSDVEYFKKNAINDISQIYNVIAVIGDRANDVIAAQNSNIPSIVLISSVNQMSDMGANSIGFQICTNWEQIGNAIKTFMDGDSEMKELRRLMIDNYSKWLSDIDNKLAICVTIATILCGFSVSAISKAIQSKDTLSIIMIYITFFFSFLSLIFAIRGFTSRNTSGKNAGNAVAFANYLRQGFRILFGREDKDEEVKKHFERFKDSDPVSQSMAHRNFFFTKYGSYEPDILWNYRLFDIRLSNYSKLTGERFASSFLMISICSLVIWISVGVIKYFVV